MSAMVTSESDSEITQPTLPVEGLDSFQPIRVAREQKPARFRGWPIVILSFLVLLFLMYFFTPARTNILILGIDGGLGRGELGRTDTIILTSFLPIKTSIGMLSIPRDLWVPIEGHGENRINTAYFFAEAESPGNGPMAVMKTITANFGVPVDYYVVIKMDGLVELIDALGGVDLNLSKPTAGLPAGRQHLNGNNALAFARNRSGSDDFSRMAQGQILIKAILERLLKPNVWQNLPDVLHAAEAVINLDIPLWQWPRLIFVELRLGQDNIDNRTITREMVRPFTTNQGAQVLGPNWDEINRVTKELFGK